VDLIPDSLPPLAWAILEAAWVLGVVLTVAWERRPPASTLAWILVLALLPVVGLPVYLLLGPKKLARRRLRMARARSRLGPAREAWGRVRGAELSAAGQLMRLLTRLTGTPPESARVTLLPGGDQALDAIVEAVAAARHHVHLEYYIFRPDRSGARLRHALAAAAARGVAVKLLVDAAGSASLPRAFLRPLLDAGGRFARFHRVAHARLGQWVGNFRTHRKIAVVDGQVGFTGGINITDDESRAARGAQAWRDTHLRLEGAAVHGLQAAFLENWFYALRAEGLPAGTGAAEAYFPPGAGGGQPVQIVASGPDQEEPAVAALFQAALAGARERAWITAPYLVPDEPLLAALRGAALRGLDVRILVPARSDSAIVDAAGRSFHDALLRAGVRLFLYGPPMIHAKTWVVDRSLALVGTANLDPRSLRLNFEVVAAVYGGSLPDELAALFEQDLGRARERTGREARDPFRRRLLASAARLLAPQL